MTEGLDSSDALKERFFIAESMTKRTHEGLKDVINILNAHKERESEDKHHIDMRLKSIENEDLPKRMRTLENMVTEFKSLRYAAYVLLFLAATQNEAILKVFEKVFIR